MAQDHHVTAAGTLVGTLPYMAPEQVEGRETDARTDIWALGCLLYEMVTGQRAFAGATTGSLVGAILAKEPAPLATQQPLTPPGLERLVRRCLAKDPDQRWESAHDVADELRWVERERVAGAPAGGPAAPITAVTTAPARRPILRALGIGLGLLAIGGLGAIAGWLAGRVPSSPRATVVRALIPVAPAERVESVPALGRETAGGTRTAIGITRDGTRLVFVGRIGAVSRLYVRPLDGRVAQELQGTEGAEAPVFSPDGRWIAFWAGGHLKKIQADGGPVMAICKLNADQPPIGISWGDDGRIVFGLLRGGLMSVPADGGAPVVLTRLEPGEVSHRLPYLLPGGKWVLFTARKSAWVWGEEHVVAQSLLTGERKTVMVGGADVRFVPTGHLVYLQLGTLMARGFDPDTLSVSGSAAALVDDIAHAVEGGTESDVTGCGHYGVSSSGTLIYLAGGVASPALFEVAAVDRNGRVSPLAPEPAPFTFGGDISPNGRFAAATTKDRTGFGLWMVDLARGTKTRLVEEGEIFWPKWTPDGLRIAFTWRAGGTMSVGWVTADSTAPPERLVTTDAVGSLAPLSWSPDGRTLAVNVLQPDGQRDISVLSLDHRDKGLSPLIQSNADEINGTFAPDGKWFAYASNETGRYEIYLQRYPLAGQKLLVSEAGGVNPVWHPGGRELFYVTAPDRDGRRWLAATSFASQPQVSLGKARKLFEVTFRTGRVGSNIAVFPAGDRFLIARAVPSAPPAPVTMINLVDHWVEELKAKVPTR
jgi:serine/threonine-protein kinase